MSFYSLPVIAEDAFTNYLSANFTDSYQKIIPDSEDTITGSYSFVRSFSTDELTYPAVIVSVGQLKELEPATHVYNGTLGIAIVSQIDDVADPVAAHLEAVKQVYSAMADAAVVKTGVNNAEFHLWQIYGTSYDQELSRGDRDIKTILEYAICAQTLPV